MVKSFLDSVSSFCYLSLMRFKEIENVIIFFRLFTGADAKKLVEVQAILVSVIQGAENVPKTMKNKFKSTLANQFSEPTLVSKYLTVYKLLDPSLPGLVLGSVFQFWTEELAKTTNLLELLVKLVISNKIKTQPHVLRSLQPLFKTITHDEFKASLLPPMMKAMLRNPELVMEAFR